MPDLAAPPQIAPTLTAEALGYRYATASRPALSDVTLEVGAGEFVVLAGRSASGKTTLLRAACGLVPHFFGGELSGTVRVAGLDTADAGPGELAPTVGYVAQEPETQVVSTTVGAEIALPLELHGASATDRARAVEEVALALAIPHLLRSRRRHALGRRAATGRARGGTGHAPLACACSTSRPRSSIRSPATS